MKKYRLQKKYEAELIQGLIEARNFDYNNISGWDVAGQINMTKKYENDEITFELEDEHCDFLVNMCLRSIPAMIIGKQTNDKYKTAIIQQMSMITRQNETIESLMETNKKQNMLMNKYESMITRLVC